MAADQIQAALGQARPVKLRESRSLRRFAGRPQAGSGRQPSDSPDSRDSPVQRPGALPVRPGAHRALGTGSRNRPGPGFATVRPKFLLNFDVGHDQKRRASPGNSDFRIASARAMPTTRGRNVGNLLRRATPRTGVDRCWAGQSACPSLKPRSEAPGRPAAALVVFAGFAVEVMPAKLATSRADRRHVAPRNAGHGAVPEVAARLPAGPSPSGGKRRPKAAPNRAGSRQRRHATPGTAGSDTRSRHAQNLPAFRPEDGCMTCRRIPCRPCAPTPSRSRRVEIRRLGNAWSASIDPAPPGFNAGVRLRPGAAPPQPSRRPVAAPRPRVQGRRRRELAMASPSNSRRLVPGRPVQDLPLGPEARLSGIPRRIPALVGLGTTATATESIDKAQYCLI